MFNTIYIASNKTLLKTDLLGIALTSPRSISSTCCNCLARTVESSHAYRRTYRNDRPIDAKLENLLRAVKPVSMVQEQSEYSTQGVSEMCSK